MRGSDPLRPCTDPLREGRKAVEMSPPILDKAWRSEVAVAPQGRWPETGGAVVVRAERAAPHAVRMVTWR